MPQALPTYDLLPNLTLSNALVRDPNLPASMPGNVENVRAVYDQRIWNEAMNASDTSARIEAVRNSEREEQQRLRNYYEWKTVYPTVLLRAQDNTHVPPEYLDRDYNPAWGPPPVVQLYILPRKKPMPKDGLSGGLGIASAMLAVIGTLAGGVPGIVLGAAAGFLAVAAAGAQAKWASSFKFEADMFKPQYAPKAFFIPLPLDRAVYIASREDRWFMLPAAAEQFRNEMANGIVQNGADAIRSLTTGEQSGNYQRLDEGLTFQRFDPVFASAPLSNFWSNRTTAGASGAGASGGVGNLFPLLLAGGAVLFLTLGE